MKFRKFVNESMTFVYHASPKSDIHKLVPQTGVQSYKQNQPGVYVSPNFATAINWAVGFVSSKRKSGNYSNITIYKIEVPRSVLKNSWSSNDWDSEYFITADNADRLKIVGRQTFKISELKSQLNRMDDMREKIFEIDRYAELVKKTNLAAKYYLLLKKKVSEKSLKFGSGFIAQNQRSVSTVNEILQKLKGYFLQFRKIGYANCKAVERLTVEQEKEVENLMKNHTIQYFLGNF